MWKLCFHVICSHCYITEDFSQNLFGHWKINTTENILYFFIHCFENYALNKWLMPLKRIQSWEIETLVSIFAKLSLHISVFILLLCRWAAVQITKWNTCQFTFINICECSFAYRFNLYVAGRWQASRLTYNNPSSSCMLRASLQGHTKHVWMCTTEKTRVWAGNWTYNIDYLIFTMKMLTDMFVFAPYTKLNKYYLFKISRLYYFDFK